MIFSLIKIKLPYSHVCQFGFLFRLVLALLMGWGIVSQAVSQVSAPDSLQQNRHSLDSALLQNRNAADSLIQAPANTMERLEHKADSLVQSPEVIQKADSLQKKSRKKLRRARQKADSINQAADVNRHIQNKAQQVQQQGSKPKKVKESKEAVSNIEQNTGLDITPDAPGVPAVDSPDLLPKIPEEKLPDLPQIPAADLPGINKSDISIPDMSMPDGKLPGLSESPTPLPKANTVEKAAENQFTKMAEGGELQKQQKAMEAFKNQPALYQKQGERYQDKNYWRQQAQQRALKVLQTQTATLEETKSSLTKLKKKYKTFQTDQKVYVKKASLKDEPLKKRITAGFSLQIHQGPPTAFDLSPFVGYRWSKRWSTGVGGTYRWKFTSDHRLNFSQPVYGERIYGEWIVVKSFFLHGEGEALRAYVPSFRSSEQEQRWVRTMLLGGGKQYEITKKLKGNVVYLYTFPYLPYGPYKLKHQIRFGLIFL